MQIRLAEGSKTITSMDVGRDDIGELITRIKAVEYYLNKTGDVPCNIKFLIEGEEEIGSLHLKEYLTVYKKKFECDAVIWEGGFIDSKERPIISLGQKGILSVELLAKVRLGMPILV